MTSTITRRPQDITADSFGSSWKIIISVYKRIIGTKRGKGDGGIGGFVEKLLVNGVTLAMKQKEKNDINGQKRRGMIGMMEMEILFKQAKTLLKA